MTYQYSQSQAMRIKKISFASLFALILFSVTVLREYELTMALGLILVAVIVLIIGHLIYTYPVTKIMQRDSDTVTVGENIIFHVDNKDYSFENIDKIHIAPRYFKITANGKNYIFYRIYENDKQLANEIERWVKDKE